MSRLARLCAVVLLTLGVLAPSRPASAVIFLCSDICVSWQSCTRQCYDDWGMLTNCGGYGCCTGKTCPT